MTTLHEPIIAITTLVAASTGTVTIRPAATDEWILTGFGTSVLSAAASGFHYAGELYLTDGTNDVALRLGATSTGSATQQQWRKPFRIGITNSYYAKIKNVYASGSVRFLYSGTTTGIGTTGVGDLQCGITASVASGSYVTIQPPTNEGWVLLEAGQEAAGWKGTGLGQEPYPDITVRIYNGANEVYALTGSDGSFWTPLRLVFTNSTYLRIYNADTSARNIGYICQRVY